MESTVPEGHSMADDLTSGRQSDAFDFLEYILEMFKNVETGSDTWNMRRLFRVEHEHEWVCDHCKRPTVKRETSLSISLNILEPKGLVSMMSFLLTNGYQEQLTIRCESESCKARFGAEHDGQVRTRRMYITHAPEVLLIRIPRWEQVFDEELNEIAFKRFDDKVLFDEFLNFGELIRDDKPLIYKLQSVVAHSGQSMDGGHYVSAVRQLDGLNFRTINDDTVTQQWDGVGNVLELQQPSTNSGLLDACVLFYSKVEL